VAGKKKKKKGGAVNALLTLGIIVCIGVMGYSAYQLVSAGLAYKEGEEEYAGLRKYTVEAADTPAQSPEGEMQETSGSTGEDGQTSAVPPLEVDFASLQAINPDIVGWLYIEALDISYPVVQGTDNDYYLHRTFEGKDNFSGSIFVEYRNSGDFTDSNTIVYGHNMKNQSMFGKLKLLTEQQKYQESPYFWILTPDQDYRYQIFSMQVTAADSDVYTLFTNPGQEFVDYLYKMQDESEAALPLEEEFTAESRIVTLSTCTSSETDRFVVQGVLLPQ
jgi:sortase B